MLEISGRDKHSSLLQKSVNYGQKSFITLAPDGQLGEGESKTTVCALNKGQGCQMSKYPTLILVSNIKLWR